MLPRTLKGFSVTVDGRGYVGKLNSGQLPKISLKLEDFRDGGMDAPVELDMGVEKMESTFGFAEFNKELFKLFGLLNGRYVPLILRGSMEGEDGVNSVITANMRGTVKELDGGDWKSGDKSELKFMMTLRYYRLEIDGEELIEIDPENTIRKIGGVDQLAARRQALGF